MTGIGNTAPDPGSASNPSSPADLVAPAHIPEPPFSPGLLGLAQRVVAKTEDWIIIAVLALMVALPIIEIVGRKAFGKGISGSAEFVQHGTLVVGMLGAAIAARKNRLLTLATTEMLPVGRPRAIARFIAGVVGAAVSAVLAYASVQFLHDDPQLDEAIAYGIKRLWLTASLPLGFGAIALRIVWHAADRWPGRLAALLVTAGIVAGAAWSPVPPERMIWPLMAVLIVGSALGTPIFALMGGAALILFWGHDEPVAAVPLAHHTLSTNVMMPTVKLFTLAGYFLAEGGASRRLLDVFTAWFGWIRGGPAIVTVLICAFFTSFTGASGVTVLALGGLLMPILVAAKFSQRNALGLLTGAGSLGMLLPPCLPLILYAIIAKEQIKQIFLAALLPGLLQIAMVIALGLWQSSKDAQTRQPFVARNALGSLWRAKWELLLPVVALVALFGGFATPVEASALTALYALITQTLLSRDMSFRRDVPRAMVECGLVIGGVLIIIGVAQGFTNYLVDAEIPAHAVEWVTSAVKSPAMFLLLLNVFLLVVGCVMEVFAAIIVVVPLILPLGLAYHIDPLHLGVIFLANLELGFLMPPVGMNLCLSSYRFHKPMAEVCRSVLPTLGVMAVSVLIITYVPWMTTWLPSLFATPIGQGP
ncbi:MAG: TRAP transporter large permease subunit [Planctomycetota bacterium]|nr:TRAP transporter large permease subunit [Planctomycetota bacterium]